MQVFETLAFYLSYPFVRYALICGVLIALCTSLLGVTLVLRRFSFLGDGLSHVAFGAVALAAVLRLTNNTPLVLVVTVICAVLLLRTGKKRKIHGDAGIAMLSVGALAVGYLLLNVFSVSSNIAGDVCSTLFGATSILTLSAGDTILCAVLSLIVLVFFVCCYHTIFDITFDEDFARAVGTRAGAYQTAVAVMVAVMIVLAMNLVGSLLVSAFIIFPALSAMRVCRSFLGVTVCGAICSVVSAVGGILISIAAETPTGATIVAADIVVFAVMAGVGAIARR